MRFAVETCPYEGCDNSQIYGSADMVACAAVIDRDPKTGEMEYSGHTEIFWDGQINKAGDPGTVTLQCANGHEWDAATIDTARERGAHLAIRVPGKQTVEDVAFNAVLEFDGSGNLGLDALGYDDGYREGGAS